MKGWFNVFRKDKNEAAEGPRFIPEPLDELYSAIRRDDIEGVRSALGKGASLNVCTCDNEGYHTPPELAERRGQTMIAELLRAAVEKEKRSAPEPFDET